MQYPIEELDRQVDASVEERKAELLEPFDFISRLSSELWEAHETGVWRGKVDQLYLPEDLVAVQLFCFSLSSTSFDEYSYFLICLLSRSIAVRSFIYNTAK